MPNAVSNAAPLVGPASIDTIPPEPVDPSLVASLVAKICNLPLTAAAVTPVIEAAVITAASPATVLVAPTVINVSLINMLAPTVNVAGLAVPATVAHDAFHSSVPICTQRLLEFL